MNTEKKDVYIQPVLVMHEALLDITAAGSGGLFSCGNHPILDLFRPKCN
jgi:hypothetical protein